MRRMQLVLSLASCQHAIEAISARWGAGARSRPRAAGELRKQASHDREMLMLALACTM